MAQRVPRLLAASVVRADVLSSSEARTGWGSCARRTLEQDERRFNYGGLFT